MSAGIIHDQMQQIIKYNILGDCAHEAKDPYWLHYVGKLLIDLIPGDTRKIPSRNKLISVSRTKIDQLDDEKATIQIKKSDVQYDITNDQIVVSYLNGTDLDINIHARDLYGQELNWLCGVYWWCRLGMELRKFHDK